MFAKVKPLDTGGYVSDEAAEKLGTFRQLYSFDPNRFFERHFTSQGKEILIINTALPCDMNLYHYWSIVFFILVNIFAF